MLSELVLKSKPSYNIFFILLNQNTTVLTELQCLFGLETCLFHMTFWIQNIDSKS